MKNAAPTAPSSTAMWFVTDARFFGSRASFTLWGRAAAWVGRSLAAIVDPLRARAEIYVDDPLLATRSSEEVVGR